MNTFVRSCNKSVDTSLHPNEWYIYYVLPLQITCIINCCSTPIRTYGLQAGLDSLGAVELRNAITAAFDISLPATITFDYPTPASLAGFLSSQMAPVEFPDDMIMSSCPGESMPPQTSSIMGMSMRYPGAEFGGERLTCGCLIVNGWDFFVADDCADF